MEALKRHPLRDLPLRKAFIALVSTTVCLIVLCSAVTIGGCAAVRNWLLPASNDVFLTIDTRYPDGSRETSSVRMTLGEDTTFPFLSSSEDEEAASEEFHFQVTQEAIKTSYRITRIDDAYSSLSPKRKLLYRSCGVAMVAFPVLYSIVGILLCGFSFYRRKLLTPIQLLSDATNQIAQQNLDFSLTYDSKDEMGKLCHSFESMRQALVENNQAMWEMLTQRRQLQASVAHDLRNPIAIIQGYTEFLQLRLATGQVEPEKLPHILSNIGNAAKRLEQYTDSIRDLNQLEELEATPEPLQLTQMLDDLTEDFTLMAQQAGMTFTLTAPSSPALISLDRQFFYRVLENLFQNALRYAKHAIHLTVTVEEHLLTAVLTDDGIGFPPQLLTGTERYFFTTEQEGGHMGMGLTISRLLCQKHGGTLTLSNPPDGGAQVTLFLRV